MTLGADAPLGILRSEVLVTLANGQRLVLPATAFVRAAAWNHWTIGVERADSGRGVG